MSYNVKLTTTDETEFFYEIPNDSIGAVIAALDDESNDYAEIEAKEEADSLHVVCNKLGLDYKEVRAKLKTSFINKYGKTNGMNYLKHID